MANVESFEIKNTTTLYEDDLKGLIVNLKRNTEELFAIAESGSPMSFLSGAYNRTARTTERQVSTTQRHPTRGQC